jgi:phosphatidylserine/phosphatidylglycerophosphate/cardiolipin synthase-like enzyme
MPLIFDHEHYESVVEEGILRATRFIWIATANIKDLHVVKGKRARSLLSHFSTMAAEGVAIRILHAADPSRRFQASFDKYDNLIEGGVEMQPCCRLHSKIVVVDNELAYLGSANLTGAGLGAKSDRRRNFEAGIITRDRAEIERIMDYFDSIWMGKHCPDCALRDECGEPIN